MQRSFHKLNMDIRSMVALDKIQMGLGVRVSFTEFSDSQLVITSNEAIEKFGISLPAPIWLYSPDKNALEHPMILRKILKAIESEC